MTRVAVVPAVTGATYGRWVDAVMEDQACELRADVLLFNHSPEPDSLFEHIATLYRAVPDLAEPLIPLAAELRRLVARGYRVEQPIVAELDDMRRRTRGVELNGRNPSSALTAKAVARRLREPLAVLADRGAAREDGRALAYPRLGAIFREVPEALLRAPAVTHELAPRKAAELSRLLDLRASTKSEAAGEGGFAKSGEGTPDRAC